MLEPDVGKVFRIFICNPTKPPFSTAAPNTTQSNDEGSSADGLVLRLIGRAKTRVMRETTVVVPNGSDTSRTTTHREVISEEKDFLSYEVQLASFGGKATTGSHGYPFSVMLPPGLPPSMQVRGDRSTLPHCLCSRLGQRA